METHLVQACHAPQQPLKNHLSGHLGAGRGGDAELWLAEEMLNEQCQRVDIPAHARTAHNGLPYPSCPLNDQMSQGTEQN